MDSSRKGDLIARLKPREKNCKRFTCTNPKKSNVSQFPALKDGLPDSYEYHICDYKTISVTRDHVNFRASLRMTLSTEDEIKLWLKSHPVTWRVDRTDPGKRKKVLFKVDFRCQHKIRPRGVDKVSVRSKNTNCPAKMTVTLLRTQVSRGRQSQSNDPHVPTFPTIVAICSDHNHDINVAEALRHQDAVYETQASLNRASGAGDSPCSASDEAHCDLEPEDAYTFSPVSSAYCYREEELTPVGPDTGSSVNVVDDSSDENTDLEMEAEKEQLSGCEEVSHHVAAAEFSKMCQELCAIIHKDPSFTASAAAAVTAYKKIKHRPSKIDAALHMFGRYMDSGLETAQLAGPAVRVQQTAESRTGEHLGERRHLNLRHSTGFDHVYSNSAKRHRHSAPCSGSEGSSHPQRMSS